MKKGFTLVELLAVIIILGILGLIATVTINNNIKESTQKAYDIQIENIMKGARNWAGSNVFSLPEKEGESIVITLGQLKEKGFAEDNIINPKTNEEFDNNLQIKITRTSNNYNYEIVQ